MVKWYNKTHAHGDSPTTFRIQYDDGDTFWYQNSSTNDRVLKNAMRMGTVMQSISQFHTVSEGQGRSSSAYRSAFFYKPLRERWDL